MEGRDAYLNLADEMDPIGACWGCDHEGVHPYDPAEWDGEFTEAAKGFAKERGLPFPPLDGLDLAIERVRHSDASLAQ